MRHWAREEPQTTSPTRRTRLIQLGIVTAAVVAAMAAILIATGAGGSPPPRPGSTRATAADKEINALLAGIPQKANVLGNPNAPVTLQWYADLECPFCKEFTLGALPSIIQKWVRGGKLRIEYRSMETATHQPEVFKTQQIAALAAGEQNKLWSYIELFYHEQGIESSGYVTESYLQGIASQIAGLSLIQWTSDRGNPALATQVATDRQVVHNKSFRGTPSFLIGRSTNTMKEIEHGSLTNPTSFNEDIEEQLKA
jgi:protein-disulfide isomerase